MTESAEDQFEDYSAMSLWLHDLSIDPATRVAGGLMIFVGSLLGLLLGIVLISSSPYSTTFKKDPFFRYFGQCFKSTFALINENSSTTIIYPLSKPNKLPRDKSTKPDFFG